MERKNQTQVTEPAAIALAGSIGQYEGMRVTIVAAWDPYQSWYYSIFEVDGNQQPAMATDIDSPFKCLQNLNEGRFLPANPVRLSSFKTKEANFEVSLDAKTYAALSAEVTQQGLSLSTALSKLFGITQLNVSRL